ncbi:sulfite exporter TauE/SafE family protein [Parvularcula maris]|uniref:Probable membrane transporter protein n=1 Tax=Parvularcula maris TaxID=2965077 RepID=A0A9X2RJL4_9PROT|nr:sulfite exporter TauE/SafE family protein [Parvularcula maris]MCQ8184863.1 sulfite exporter TauE/SafE family protein [Parvularcula maris]
MSAGVLAILFLLTAALYASVGFGGGSTYTALLAAADTDYRVLPLVSLSCNIAVVSGGVWRFAKAGALPWAKALPLCAASVPLAWLGGSLAVPETLFLLLLGVSLLAAGCLMLTPVPRKPASLSAAALPRPSAYRVSEPVMGGGLGLLSGMVGIGGGIFLAPLLYLTRWDEARRIAGTASLFILVNSAAGMAGQFSKLAGTGALGEAASFWPLLLAVLIGGQAGALLGSVRFSQELLRRLTAVLILVVACRLLLRALVQMELF